MSKIKVISVLITLLILISSCANLQSKRTPANAGEESLMMFHWGDAVGANAPTLNDAGFPWKQGQPDAHFNTLNGANGEAIRQGTINQHFMNLLLERQKAMGGNVDTKGGTGYYTSTDFLKWFGWNGGYDLLIVEARANNISDLTADGPNGPIIEIVGGINPIIKRAPTEEELREKGISIVIRPPTESDIERIFESQTDKSTFLKNLVQAETRLKRMQPPIERRTPIVQEIFKRLRVDYGKNYLETLPPGTPGCFDLMKAFQ